MSEKKINSNKNNSIKSREEELKQELRNENNLNFEHQNSQQENLSDLGDEKISISNFAFPLMAIYKTNLSEKIGIKLESGIAFNLLYKSSMSSRSGSFDYEAVYKYPSGFSNIPGQDYYDPRTSLTATGYSETSWLITKDYIDQLGVDRINYFDKMRNNGYPVGLGLDPKSINKTASFTPGISLIFRPSVSYYFNKGRILNLSFFYSIFNASQQGSYRMMDENKHYNTLMQGVSTISTAGYGIRISYAYSLNYNILKWTKELSGLL